jgi:hypothetical protein
MFQTQIGCDNMRVFGHPLLVIVPALQNVHVSPAVSHG